MSLEPIAVGNPYKPVQVERRGPHVVRTLGAGVVAVLLPFVVLIRGASYLYLHRGFGAWAAVLAALLLAAGILTGYAGWVSWRLTRRIRVRLAFRWVVLPAVVLYGGYTLSYLSQTHAKSPEVRSYYRHLHPVLRLALGTLTLWDRDLVVTDLLRESADYARMGLPRAQASLHYPQADGYVHAVDLRTRGQAAWRTGLTQAYFRFMGFATLRHIGTADHLHVALRPP